MPWWDYAREHYLDLNQDTEPVTTTLYYDPVLDVHHRLPVSLALTTSYYAAPQVPEDARRLFLAACASIGLDSDPSLPLNPGRGYGSSLILAREWELRELEARIAAAIEASYEPTWDEATGEFTWGMGLDEPHPRGQFNAFLAAAEATGPGMWTRLSDAPLEYCPQITGVDFPTIALSRAEWIDRTLHLRLAPLQEDPGEFTAFNLVGAAVHEWVIHGIEHASIMETNIGFQIHVPIVAGDLRISPAS
jgi:hypothetical protein